MKVTLEDAQKIDTSIKLSDVKYFVGMNVNQKQMKGSSPFIAPCPDYEYQIKLFC